VNNKTPFVLDTTIIVAVGLDDPSAEECRRALAPLTMLRVNLSAEATECVRAVRPVLVVLRSTKGLDHAPDLLDEAASAGAAVLVLDELAATDTIASALAREVRNARGGQRAPGR
jgi:hypothetical protein